ncbi:4-(cytidine 5'-diphospho)-2-C-methyl-D-erythritol kinase [Pseudochrobactrum sp. sp1633]|uniref:4-(cytidine 5'-diphospho)-2-C-methyl-D-erythritol kinase n=1 Tax=Pseudochrobactrum sp. sp1633 TaxID=3036706 RepID=UPI0025A512FE|nr:4-(cytidine 5'-diphospho)-2-C-methyl-D-erythritol kinase [Pseudochrobactrum sp. sp1633]MDM8346500.1 4-(cytidine 5'-diphospho)-2-C-methyl-D-erythritol kinase [Pseudochrobactrum sp. sp1633]HWD12716.1 4-(cytidine 5'-diphospho)-2-C-methyl-D-erythritol kinase [Pseudochrobactrum sp.]
MPDIFSMQTAPASSALQATAYAKLNLALHVTGRRDDGYHLLDTLVAFAGYGDEITISPAQEDSFTLSGRFGQQLPVNGDNLVLKARDALREHFPQQSTAIAIHLEKNLPVASGIGGGSSDAATLLALLIRLWNIKPEQTLLKQICLQLGADVPMCLHGQLYGGALIAKGIGEDVQSLSGLPVLPLVLVNDGTAISTPQIFKHMHKRDNPALPELARFDSHAELCNFLKTTRNDLLPPAAQLAPQLPEILQILRDCGAHYAQMSGSGATCFGIYDTLPAAQQAAEVLQQQNPHWFVCATTTLPNKA